MRVNKTSILDKAPDEILTGFPRLSEQDRTELWQSGSIEQREAMFDAYWDDVRERERIRSELARTVGDTTLEIEPVPDDYVAPAASRELADSDR